MMRLVVKQNGDTVSEFQFSKGPVYLGRHTHSQVFLPDRAVSRQHAVIFSTPDGKWMVEDLDSANKTFLNGEAVHKAQIKTGDRLRIGDFTIEVNLEGASDVEGPTRLEDTLITNARKQQIIVRKPDAEHAPDINLPARRVKDFLEATEKICKTSGLDEVLQALLNITLRQFSAYHVWCALRNQPAGALTSHAGKGKDGQVVELGGIQLNEKITYAIEKGQFLLLPNVEAQTNEEKICSAMIAPIMDPDGCFGVLYVDNAAEQEQYSLSDLDYLMMLAIHTAAIVENF